MAVVRCPQCTLPMTDTEAAAGVCPVCGVALQTKQATAPLEVAAPERKESSPSLALLWSFLGGVLVLSASAMWFYSAPQKPRDETQVAEINAFPPAKEPLPQVKAPEVKAPEPEEEERPAPPPPAPKETPRELRTKTAVQLPDKAPKVAALLPAPATVAKVDAPRRGIPPLRFNLFTPIPKPINNDPFNKLAAALALAGRETPVNSPNGSITLPPITGGRTVKLTGVVKTLKVTSLDNKSVLDASRLEAREIIILRGINDGSTAKLNAPDGIVTFEGQVNNGSNVVVTAPGGKVLFQDANNNINSDSRITITASDVEFRGQINGDGTQINVTLTRGGQLKFREINGAARLHYKNADATLPDPRIEAGIVRNTAELKKLVP